MEIGERLRQLRQQAKLSQGDIEERTGLLRCYVSRVECGHTIPSLRTLEKWARALGVEPYQLHFSGEGKPSTPKVGPRRAEFSREETNLVEIFRRVAPQDQKLLLQLSRF